MRPPLSHDDTRQRHGRGAGWMALRTTECSTLEYILAALKMIYENVCSTVANEGREECEDFGDALQRASVWPARRLWCGCPALLERCRPQESHHRFRRESHPGRIA